MCELTDKIITKKIIVYKVVMLDEETQKMYSSFTGQEFKIGKVEKAPEICTPLTDYWTKDLKGSIFKHVNIYKEKYNGYTSGFINIEDAQNLLRRMQLYPTLNENHKLILIAMTSKKGIKGYYTARDIIAIDKINFIKII